MKKLCHIWVLFILFNLESAAPAQDAAGGAMRISPSAFPGMSNMISPNGKLTIRGFHFSTKAYENEALRLVISEANQAALALGLTETLPITESKLTRKYILGYGMTFLPPGMIGNIHTRDYGYFVSVGHKLSYIEWAHQDEDVQKWAKKYQWPKERMDTNEAYQLAEKWMTEASMDVKGLNQDCKLVIQPDPYANAAAGLQASGRFVPIYYLYWQSHRNESEGFGSVASVKLLAPEKRLISLRVEESKYILREPLVFTNLVELLRLTNAPEQAVSKPNR